MGVIDVTLAPALTALDPQQATIAHEIGDGDRSAHGEPVAEAALSAKACRTGHGFLIDGPLLFAYLKIREHKSRETP